MGGSFRGRSWRTGRWQSPSYGQSGAGARGTRSCASRRWAGRHSRGPRRGRCTRRRGCRRRSSHGKSPRDLPLHPKEDLDFKFTWQPFVRERFAFRISITACTAAPGLRFITNQFLILHPVPERAPLDAILHIVIAKCSIDFSDWIGKFGGSINWQAGFIDGFGEL